MATNEEILTPKALVVPKVGDVITQAHAPAGTLVMSGANLCYATTPGVFRLIAIV